MYQLDWGINVAGNLVARDGFGQPYFATTESSDPSFTEKRVLLVDPDDSRLPGVVSFDMRVGKSFLFSGRELAFDFDIFNLLNSLHRARPAVRRHGDRLDRLQSAARDHEPAAGPAGREVPLLTTKGQPVPGWPSFERVR